MPKLDFIDAPSQNFDDRHRPIRFCMLHYTGMETAEEALNALRFPTPRYAPPPPPSENSTAPIAAPTERVQIGTRRVSSHYLVYPDGRIFSLVPEHKRAWHAGAGAYGGETDMNSASIGIEIQNGGHDFGLPPYPDMQIEAVMALVQGIKLRHGLDKQHVIGHADWAPGRKLDPGEHFPWERLAHAGISLHIPVGEGDGNHQILVQTENASNDFVSRAQIGLRKIGYGLPQTDIFDIKTKDTIIAFQRRFRQADVAGNLDVETLAKIERLADIVLPS
ncbi:MAG: N-acetylmuramoyl-L-alanine amidase [Hyphomonadaceae bacterium]|nr:MAG: N-acetylmuramoyl-L-alanine amidase [Hyphomonadaceae bacterium]